MAIVSRRNLFIDFSGGNFQLLAVKSWKVKDEAGRELALTVGPLRPVGSIDKAGGINISLDVFRQDKPEVDYRLLFRSGEVFSFVTQDVNGSQRLKLVGVQVSNVSDSAHPGENMDEVSLIATDIIPLPAVA